MMAAYKGNYKIVGKTSLLVAAKGDQMGRFCIIWAIFRDPWALFSEA